MCVIVDANVASHVFDETQQTEAGKCLLKWIESGRPLIIGGQHKVDLYKHSGAKKWVRKWTYQARRVGLFMFKEYTGLDQKIQELKKRKLKSNDHHIIALAQVSRARLLYTEDGDLKTDFKNKNLINHPRGKLYPSSEKPREIKKFLENNKSICRRP